MNLYGLILLLTNNIFTRVETTRVEHIFGTDPLRSNTYSERIHPHSWTSEKWLLRQMLHATGAQAGWKTNAIILIVRVVFSYLRLDSFSRQP